MPPDDKRGTTVIGFPGLSSRASLPSSLSTAFETSLDPTESALLTIFQAAEVFAQAIEQATCADRAIQLRQRLSAGIQILTAIEDAALLAMDKLP